VNALIQCRKGLRSSIMEKEVDVLKTTGAIRDTRRFEAALAGLTGR
jgi:hypothetical protein